MPASSANLLVPRLVRLFCSTRRLDSHSEKILTLQTAMLSLSPKSDGVASLPASFAIDVVHGGYNAVSWLNNSGPSVGISLSQSHLVGQTLCVPSYSCCRCQTSCVAVLCFSAETVVPYTGCGFGTGPASCNAVTLFRHGVCTRVLRMYVRLPVKDMAGMLSSLAVQTATRSRQIVVATVLQNTCFRELCAALKLNADLPGPSFASLPGFSFPLYSCYAHHSCLSPFFPHVVVSVCSTLFFTTLIS